MIDLQRPKANKDLGQHYLNDTHIIDKICSDYASEAEYVIEIGPGPGVLTQHLSNLKKPFFVIEKDTRFKTNLELYLKQEQILFADALRFDGKIENGTWLVSNLPYNISVPLFIKFLKMPEIEYMTLMFQKEVGEKIIPLSHIKNPMNSLLALSENYCEGKLLCKVPPGAFSPPPQVSSVVISLKRRKKPVVPIDQFDAYEKFLRNLFAMKRKQVGSVLKHFYDENQVKNSLDKSSLSTIARAEAFNLEQVQLLYKNLIWE